MRRELGCLWGGGGKGSCWHPWLAEARGAGPLLPARFSTLLPCRGLQRGS